MRRLGGIALALAFVASGCTKTTTGSAVGGRVNSWTIPHTLRYATAEDIHTLNPHLGQELTMNLMAQLTMAYLIRWDEHNRPYPELATEVPTKENGGVSKDGLTITYHLRKGVKWSDGAPFDADDVVFSIKTVLNPANNEVSRTGWDLISKIDEPNKYTVVLHMKQPYSPFVQTFFSTAGANPCVLPKHLLAKYPNINHVPYNALPVGIGPFTYERWDRAQRVVMVANPLYWRGLPKLQKIVFRIVPDRNTVMSQVEAKELDLWWPVPGAFMPRVQGLRDFTVLRQASFVFNHLDFNVTHPRVHDAVVRQALRLAIDRKTLRDKIGHGLGILQDEPAPRSAPYYDPTIPFTDFDIAKANALLDGAGWKRGADGIRAKNGVKLVLDFATSTGTPDADEMIELIRGWWKQIGVGMTVRHYPSPMLFAPANEGGVVYGNKWDVVFFAWGIDAIGDLTSLYSCKSFPPQGQNDMRWCNPVAQKAMDALYTHFDQAQRNRDDAVLFEQLNEDVPTIVTSLREDVFVYNKDLKNFHPNQVSPFDNMMNVDI